MRENGLGDMFSLLLNLVSGCAESISKYFFEQKRPSYFTVLCQESYYNYLCCSVFIVSWLSCLLDTHVPCIVCVSYHIIPIQRMFMVVSGRKLES